MTTLRMRLSLILHGKAQKHSTQWEHLDSIHIQVCSVLLSQFTELQDTLRGKKKQKKKTKV